MTHTMNRYLRRGLLAAFALLLFLPAVSAQDRPARGERLTEALDLTDAQAQIVTDVLGDGASGDGASVDLWTLAAELTPTLTDAQKEKLFARPERPGRGDRMGERHEGRRSGDRMSDEDRAKRREATQERHADRHETMKAEMREALGLTDAQVQQLDALHAERQVEREEHRAEREERRAERPERKAEFAEVLTPEQQEVAEVHRALAMRLRAHRAHHRAPRR